MFFQPTPLYFMDEIDAALDFRNESIVANYIKDRTKNAQFIIISLRSVKMTSCECSKADNVWIETTCSSLAIVSLVFTRLRMPHAVRLVTERSIVHFRAHDMILRYRYR